MRKIEFVVGGTPQPQGSTSAFVRNGKTIVTSANKKLKPWRKAVTQAAMEAVKREQFRPFTKHEPVYCTMVFYLPRPKSVKRDYHTVKPDLDKLIRAILDSLTGVVFVDDSQVVGINSVKFYRYVAGVECVNIVVSGAV